MANVHELEKLTPFLWKRGPNYLHWCQGCKRCHVYPTKRINGPNWIFNGKPECPSFNPSMHIFIPATDRGDGTVRPQETGCHYYVLDGTIQYQNDCAHDLKGQTLPLQAIPEDYDF